MRGNRNTRIGFPTCGVAVSVMLAMLVSGVACRRNELADCRHAAVS
jgi:hypothetical protein